MHVRACLAVRFALYVTGICKAFRSAGGRKPHATLALQERMEQNNVNEADRGSELISGQHRSFHRPPHTIPLPYAVPHQFLLHTATVFCRNSATAGCRFSGPRLATPHLWTTYACRTPFPCPSCWRRDRSTTASVAPSMIRVQSL